MGFIGFTVDPDYKDGNMVIVCVHDKVEFWVRASIVTKHSKVYKQFKNAPYCLWCIENVDASTIRECLNWLQHGRPITTAAATRFMQDSGFTKKK